MGLHEWMRVLTSPLGLVAFALFLIFSVLAKAKSGQQKDQRFWRQLFASSAVVCLIGGLCLSFFQVMHPPSPAANPAAEKQENKDVEQKTSGSGSPAIQGVQGDVTVNVDATQKPSK